MTQPNNFGFGEEEQMLRDTVAHFFANNFPSQKLHNLVADNPDPHREPACLWDKSLWQQFVDLGWSALAVPERAGGIGMSAVAVAAVVEEVGRAAFPSPFIECLKATYVLAACNNKAADKVLTSMVEGQAVALAITNQRGSWEPAATEIAVDSNVLNGTAYYVQDAKKANHLLVSARQGNDIGLYIVPADAEGVTIVADSITDLTRDQAHICFKNVKPELVVATPGTGAAPLEDAIPAQLVILSADMCGAAQWQLQETVEYAKVRTQFDHKIGFFQAVKHPLVNLMIMIDQSRSLLFNAACAIDHEPENAEKYARMAKAAASDMAAFASRRAIQTHGGIGFTWACFQQLYFKRQMHNQQLMGDAIFQRNKLADMLIGEIT